MASASVMKASALGVMIVLVFMASGFVPLWRMHPCG
jgi:hypothetical protein